MEYSRYCLLFDETLLFYTEYLFVFYILCPNCQYVIRQAFSAADRRITSVYFEHNEWAKSIRLNDFVLRSQRQTDMVHFQGPGIGLPLVFMCT